MYLTAVSAISVKATTRWPRWCPPSSSWLSA